MVAYLLHSELSRRASLAHFFSIVINRKFWFYVASIEKWQNNVQLSWFSFVFCSFILGFWLRRTTSLPLEFWFSFDATISPNFNWAKGSHFMIWIKLWSHFMIRTRRKNLITIQGKKDAIDKIKIKLSFTFWNLQYSSGSSLIFLCRCLHGGLNHLPLAPFAFELVYQQRHSILFS